MAKGKLDDRAIAILKDLDLDWKEACWEVRPNVWAMKHRYVEDAGHKAGIVIESLEEVETNSEKGIAVIKCTATSASKKAKVITYGESSPKNTKNQYPYAMAEKRAIDRATFKLIGIHGSVYSEDELDLPEEPAAPSVNPPSAELGASLYNKTQDVLKKDAASMTTVEWAQARVLHDQLTTNNQYPDLAKKLATHMNKGKK